MSFALSKGYTYTIHGQCVGATEPDFTAMCRSKFEANARAAIYRAMYPEKRFEVVKNR